MKPVAVVGSGGAGKSTFARELGRRTGIPVIHLDQHHWKPGWVAAAADERRAIQRDLLSGGAWIVDGNYGGTFDAPIPSEPTGDRADLRGDEPTGFSATSPDEDRPADVRAQPGTTVRVSGRRSTVVTLGGRRGSCSEMDCVTRSRGAVVQAARDGDVEAWTLLVERFQDFAVAMALGYSGDWDGARDVT